MNLSRAIEIAVINLVDNAVRSVLARSPLVYGLRSSRPGRAASPLPSGEP